MLTLAMLLLSGATTDRPVQALQLYPVVRLANGVIAIADVADLSPLPPVLRQGAERIELVRFAGAIPAKVSAQHLLSRMRARMPVLALYLPSAVPDWIAIERSNPIGSVQTSVSITCMRALTALPSGTVPGSGNFAPDVCPAKQGQTAFVYDPALRSVRTARPVAAGDIVRRYPGLSDMAVKPGDMISLVTGGGMVRVERQVVALQQAREGQHLFVRTGDGDLLSVRFQGASHE